MSDIDRVIPVPHHDQSALAAQAEPPRDDTTYEGEKGLSEAANSLTEKREELRGSRGHFTHDFKSTFDLPILKYESEDKSPLSVEQAARDLTLSRDDVVIRGIAADGGDVTGLREDALRRSRDNEPAEAPAPVEIKLSDSDPQNFKELGRSALYDGAGFMDVVDGIKEWRQQQAAAQAAELAELTGQKEEAERSLAEEISQEPAPPVETPEQAQARAEYERRVVAERQRIAAVQQIQHAEHQAKTELQQIKNATLNQFPDMVRPEDIANLKVQNPQRFAHLMQLEAAARQSFDVLNKVNQAKVQTSAEHQVQQRAQAVAQRAAVHEQYDRTAEELIQKSIPNKSMEEIRKSARAMLDATGLSQAELSKAWHGEATLSMRAPQTQLIIAKAAAYDAMRAKAHEIRAKPVPPVMMGTGARSAAFHQDGNIAELKKQLAGAKGIRALQLGTELQKAQRLAKGNR